MMIVSKTAVTLMCALLVISMVLAHFFSLISTDQNRGDAIKDESLYYTNYLTDKYGMITDTPKNIIWFLQISDIHISIFRDPGRISQFQQFCDSTVKIINPLVVLASGDLTDAKAKDNLGSSQVKTEWIYYHNIIKESGVTEFTQWLDIRGNHDNFNIKTIEDKVNYFRNFSVQGTKKSYVHYADSNGVNVAFLGIDACPEPGLRRPFNFIGIIDGNELQTIRKIKSEANIKADHIVWFGHYPTSCVLSLDLNSQRLDLRQTIGETQRSQVYLCGHLHSMGGMVNKMYTKHKRGFLELELGDWKDNRLFRLGAIDHGMFSFVDTKINSWPLVLVTNPKDAHYNMPGREPLNLVSESTHVRILVFSDTEINKVKISYDKISWIQCKHKEGPLYTVLWLPHLFLKGIHIMYVSVTDDFKRETIIEHQFALDDSVVKFDMTARILLMLNAGTVFQSFFATLLLMNVLPLIILRAQKRPPRNRRRYGSCLVRRMWLLCKINHIFYPLVLYSIYLAFGPWAIGELIDGYTGAIFAWGILIKGVYLPESFTYMYGSSQILLVQIPLVFVLTHCLNMRLFCNDLKGIKKVVKNLPFIFLLTIQLLLAYFFWLEYGTMSFLLGPLRTWSIGLSVTLWFKIWTLPSAYCRNLIKLDEQTL